MPLPATAHARQPWAAPTAPVQPSRRRHPDDPLPPAPREYAVWELVARGYTGAQIAAELGISVNTVKHHVSVLHLKLGTANRAELGRLWGERHPAGDADDA